MTRDEELYQRNIENLARRHAAEKMGLRDDPYGERLPEDLWKQGVPYAERRMAFDVTQTEHGYNNVTVSGNCPTDATVEEVKKYFYHDYFGGRAAWVDNGRFGCTIHID
jgi:hypothetical protein